MPVKKVLIVDDSPTERHVLTEILQKAVLRSSLPKAASRQSMSPGRKFPI